MDLCTRWLSKVWGYCWLARLDQFPPSTVTITWHYPSPSLVTMRLFGSCSFCVALLTACITFNSFTKFVCCYICFSDRLVNVDVLVSYELSETMNEWDSGFVTKKESSWSLRFFAGSQGIPTEESYARNIRTQAFSWAGDGWTRMNLANRKGFEVTYVYVMYWLFFGWFEYVIGCRQLAKLMACVRDPLP